MFLVGLTGGIASGKSSVLQVLQQLGCAVVDVDVIARHVVQPGYPAHRRIVEAFGTEVLLENGDINRKVLGDLIFNNPDRRHLLNTITHPEIRKEMMKETFKYFLQGYRYVVLDIPLLFETKKLLKYMKHTVVVYCTSQLLNNSHVYHFTQFTFYEIYNLPGKRRPVHLKYCHIESCLRVTMPKHERSCLRNLPVVE
ncbi:dephospho-CoA kinase domain-containing protein isoform X2 [Tupaia chinensis]|uniref:dephospho-CoA kinase domain-containing protein isoform X2 n=1 Tax=Tupaia chinensis TaxID=246437 RepID=UPI000FFB8A86|nr:dephospho-CoA kinase domain-containing protein isoform X2 [Tupaia chinensis]